MRRALATLGALPLAWLGWEGAGRLVEALVLDAFDLPLRALALAGGFTAAQAIQDRLALAPHPADPHPENAAMPAQVILIAGAGGNLGRALARRLAAEGAALALLDRGGAALAAFAAELPGQHQVLADVDLTDPAATEAALRQVLDRHGRLDGVATTVGGFAFGPLAEAGQDQWELMFRLNVLTAANLFRAASGPMRAAGAGAMVATGAGPGLRAPALMAPYAAAKAGVLRLVESLAEELKREGVRVNAVLPGTIDTPQNRAAMPDADPALWVTADQVAAAMAFLLSPAASGVTGALLAVTGRG